MPYTCAECNTPIGEDSNGLPLSKYWRGKDVEEAYCSAKCSLIKHEKDRLEEETDGNSKS